MWNAEALEVRCAKDTDGGHVVGADDGGWLSGECPEFAEADDAALQRVIALDNPLSIDGESLRAHRVLEVGLASDGRVQFVRTGEEADFAVPYGDEMVNRCADTGAVVEEDGAGCGLGEFEFCEDDRDVVEGKLIENGFFFTEGEHGDAVDFALEHAADTVGEDGGITVGGADKDLVAIGNGDLFEALDQFGEEGIGNVFDDYAEEAAAA